MIWLRWIYGMVALFFVATMFFLFTPVYQSLDSAVATANFTADVATNTSFHQLRAYNFNMWNVWPLAAVAMILIVIIVFNERRETTYDVYGTKQKRNKKSSGYYP